MSRIGPISPDKMTPEQAKVYNDIAAKGGRVAGPYTAYIRIPEFMRLNQDMGDYLRRNTLPPTIRSLIVLRTVRHWGAKYAWAANRQAAEKAGVPAAVVSAIEEGRDPAGLDAKESAALAVANELLGTKALSDATYRRALEQFGEAGVADVVVTTGFYSMVSMTLNAFDIDPPKLSAE